MKSGKLWAIIVGIIVVIAIAVFLINGMTTKAKAEPVINQAVLANAGTYNTAPCNNDKVTQNMPVTTQEISLANGVSIPKGTYEAQIPGPNGNMITDYLVTGLVTPVGNEPINEYANIYSGQVVATAQPGAFISVTGYVDGYYVLGTGYSQPTFVKATDVKLENDVSSLSSIDFGNMPYAVDLAQDPGYNQTVNVYEYPTMLSKVVGTISPENINQVISENKMTVVNTANKMQDITFNGVQGWILSSAQLKEDNLA